MTKRSKKYRQELGMDNYIHGYIQSLVMKKTFESVSIDYKRNGALRRRVGEDELEKAVELIFEKCTKYTEGEVIDEKWDQAQ